jgi:hypothetical protein
VVDIWLREMAKGHKRKATIPLQESRKGKELKKEEESHTETSFISKRLCLIIPKDAIVKARLRKNLKRMECKKLLDLPWNWVNNEMVDKVARKSPPPKLKNTIKARLDKWMKEIMAATLQISKEGIGLKKRSQAEPYMKYFKEEPSQTDGWRFDQCNNQDLRDILKFLILLIKPNEPTRLNVGPIATIADYIFRDLEVSWADVFSEVVEKEVEKIDTTRIPIFLLT